MAESTPRKGRKPSKAPAAPGHRAEPGELPSVTEQILGRSPSAAAAPGAGKVPAKWQKFYRRLLALRDYLLLQHGQMEADAAGYDAKDMMQGEVESATDEADRDFAFGMASNYQETLTEVDQALKRIEQGSYGICELTGEVITKERLEAIPWTRYSAEAEKQLEAQGQSPVRTALASPPSDFRSAEQGDKESRHREPEALPPSATDE
jgi:RNA polymerase-binding transcription factor DksA